MASLGKGPRNQHNEAPSSCGFDESLVCTESGSLLVKYGPGGKEGKIKGLRESLIFFVRVKTARRMFRGRKNSVE